MRFVFLILSSLGITAFHQMLQVCLFSNLQYCASHLNTEPVVKITLSKTVTVLHTSLA